MTQHEQVVIIGSGPAGYTAAIYASRANLKPLLFEGFFTGVAGGQLMTTTDVENFPGFPEGVQGPELMKRFRDQAIRFGTKVLTEDVEAVDFGVAPFKVKGKKTEVTADTVIIATGATAKTLDIPGSKELWQKGVTACAVCDGAMPIFRNKELFVVGGGDSACEEALYLTKFGSRVYLVHRRDELRASKIMAKRTQEHPKLEVLWDSVVVEVKGAGAVQSVVLENVKTKAREEKVAGGLFFAIGHKPNTDFLAGQLATDETGYLLVKPGTATTEIPGVFACGDVQDPHYRQAITAAGSGCMAALEAERYLSSREILV